MKGIVMTEGIESFECEIRFKILAFITISQSMSFHGSLLNFSGP